MGDEPVIEILFEHERDTKRTRRFEESACRINGEATPGMATGTLYVQKWALEEAFGKELPAKVEVRITIVPAE